MKIHLKIKIKSLAAEARFIRLEEQKILGRRRRLAPTEDQPAMLKQPKKRVGGELPWLRSHQSPVEEIEAAESKFHSLRMHRINEVRKEARASQLAYAFLRGRSYAVTEHADSIKPDIAKISAMIGRFGDRKPPEEAVLKAWLAPPEPLVL